MINKQVKQTPAITIVLAAILMVIVGIAYKLFIVNEKIGYIDSAKIMSEYKGAENAKKEYQKKAQVWQANIDTLTAEVQAAIKNYEMSLAAMTIKEQQLSKQLIQTKQKQLADYQRAVQANAQQEDGQLTRSVITTINSFLLKYGKDHNYKLILIANQSGTIAYAEEGLDITPQIIDELNKEYTLTK